MAGLIPHSASLHAGYEASYEGSANLGRPEAAAARPMG